MKHQELFLTAAITASIALCTPMVNAGQGNSPEARALAAAQESPMALRHFVERTRMIYALNYSDYAVRGGTVPDADITADSAEPADESRAETAEAAAARHKRELDELREQIYRDMLQE